MSKRLKIIIAAILVVAAAAGAGLYWFFKDDAPAPVSLEAAAKSVTDTTSSSSSSSSSSASVDGTWAVDTTTGDFNYESATGTFAGFRVDEKLAAVGSTTAVGRTGDVSGSMTISGTSVTAATFTIDLTSITTNDSRRDDKVQSALETSQYPTATFTLTEPIDLGTDADSGKAISVTAVGDLTIHGVTKSVEFPLQAKLVNGTVVVVGSLDITFSDYGVETPTSAAVLSVEDHGTLELQLLFQKA